MESGKKSLASGNNDKSTIWKTEMNTFPYLIVEWKQTEKRNKKKFKRYTVYVHIAQVKGTLAQHTEMDWKTKKKNYNESVAEMERRLSNNFRLNFDKKEFFSHFFNCFNGSNYEYQKYCSFENIYNIQCCSKI